MVPLLVRVFPLPPDIPKPAEPVPAITDTPEFTVKVLFTTVESVDTPLVVEVILLVTVKSVPCAVVTLHSVTPSRQPAAVEGRSTAKAAGIPMEEESRIIFKAI